MKVLSSSKNDWVQHIAKLQKEAAYRKSEGSLILEGKKIILEAEKKGLLKNVWIQEGVVDERLAPLKTYSPTFLKENIVKKLSQLKTPDGTFAEATKPLDACLKSCRSLLILDRIQDPGNMGTLIRSAHAFGMDGVYILEGSCDPYSPKVIRSSMGAVLELAICQGDFPSLKALLQEGAFTVLVADAQGETYASLQRKVPYALVLSNESSGPSPFFQKEQKVSIPIQHIDSLNVAIAGSILMHQMQESVCCLK